LIIRTLNKKTLDKPGFGGVGFFFCLIVGRKKVIASEEAMTCE
jgi:hypothetical protein